MRLLTITTILLLALVIDASIDQSKSSEIPAQRTNTTWTKTTFSNGTAQICMCGESDGTIPEWSSMNETTVCFCNPKHGFFDLLFGLLTYEVDDIEGVSKEIELTQQLWYCKEVDNCCNILSDETQMCSSQITDVIQYDNKKTKPTFTSTPCVPESNTSEIVKTCECKKRSTELQACECKITPKCRSDATGQTPVDEPTQVSHSEAPAMKEAKVDMGPKMKNVVYLKL